MPGCCAQFLSKHWATRSTTNGRRCKAACRLCFACYDCGRANAPARRGSAPASGRDRRAAGAGRLHTWPRSAASDPRDCRGSAAPRQAGRGRSGLRHEPAAGVLPHLGAADDPSGHSRLHQQLAGADQGDGAGQPDRAAGDDLPGQAGQRGDTLAVRVLPVHGGAVPALHLGLAARLALPERALQPRQPTHGVVLSGFCSQ